MVGHRRRVSASTRVSVRCLVSRRWLERGFGQAHDVVTEVIDDAAQYGQMRQYVRGEERCGGYLSAR
jgi:hypothetical protein